MRPDRYSGWIFLWLSLLLTGAATLAQTPPPIATPAANPPSRPYESATLQALNKVTARVSELKVTPMLPASFGTLDITVHRCWHSEADRRPDQAALIEIRERREQFGQSDLLFSGWMFQSSPALSALEHPVYDITLLSCQ